MIDKRDAETLSNLVSDFYQKGYKHQEILNAITMHYQQINIEEVKKKDFKKGVFETEE
ncbi:MAG: hypothetical protein LBG95_07890 [Treponema sp.]|jgi:hypothetical protein|nr:hypothetical protein [Treponema sp.]